MTKKNKMEDNTITSQIIFNRDVWLLKSKEREKKKMVNKPQDCLTVRDVEEVRQICT